MKEIRGGLPEQYSNKGFCWSFIGLFIVCVFLGILLCREGTGICETVIGIGFMYLAVLYIYLRFSVSYVILYTFIFHGCHRPASSLPGSVLRRLFLCRQKRNWRHCHSWLRKICLSPSISLLKSLRMELPLFRFRKSSGFINIPPCTSSSGTISVSPIRCVSLQKSTYTSSVRRT